MNRPSAEFDRVRFRPTREASTTVEVDRTPGEVWEVLVAFSAYREWNPYIADVSGEAREGAVLKATITPTGAEPRSITARITTLDRERKLEWTAIAFFPWLFETKQRFILRPLNGGTEIVVRKRISGLLAPFIASEHLQSDHDAMARRLVERVS